MPGYLIKDTTVEERKKIGEESLGNISADCDGCMSGLAKSAISIWNSTPIMSEKT